jgi:hypothetical protein
MTAHASLSTPTPGLRPNVLRQSFVPRDLNVLSHETGAFNDLLDELWESIQPNTRLELATFNDLLRARWNMDRIERLEATQSEGETGLVQNEANAAARLRLHARWELAAARALAQLQRFHTDYTLRLKYDAEPEENLLPLTSGAAILRSPEARKRELATIRRDQREWIEDLLDGPFHPRFKTKPSRFWVSS